MCGGRAASVGGGISHLPPLPIGVKRGKKETGESRGKEGNPSLPTAVINKWMFRMRTRGFPLTVRAKRKMRENEDFEFVPLFLIFRAK